MKDKAILIDSSSLVYAAFYTMNNLSYNNKSTGVIFGFFYKVLSIAKKFKTNNFYFCFDHKRNFRKEKSKDYKSQRVKKRKELSNEEKTAYQSKREQEEEIKNVALKSFGFNNIYCLEGYEADDILAALCNKAIAKKMYMVTSDNDMFQCLNKCTIVNPNKLTMFSKEDFQKKYKIKPSQWALCKAIGGCNSDEVQGIKGVSDPKNISSISLKYVNGEISKGKVFERIKSKEGKELIKKNLEIVRLPMDDIDDKFILRRNNFSKKNIIKTFSKYGFKYFLDKEFNSWCEYFLE